MLSSGLGSSVLAFFGERGPVVVGRGGGSEWSVNKQCVRDIYLMNLYLCCLPQHRHVLPSFPLPPHFMFLVGAGGPIFLMGAGGPIFWWAPQGRFFRFSI
jgi:hypothetical protein